MTRVQIKPEYCSVHQNMVRGDGWGLENNTIPACSWCAEHQGMVHHRWMMFHIMVHNTIVDQHGVAWYDAVYTVYGIIHLHGAHSLVHASTPQSKPGLCKTIRSHLGCFFKLFARPMQPDDKGKQEPRLQFTSTTFKKHYLQRLGNSHQNV